MNWAVWMLRIGLAVGVFLALAAAAGWMFQGWADARDARRFPPPGRLIRIAGGLRHLDCTGAGGPTVVLVTGGGVPGYLLSPIRDRVAAFARVCAYDRAGLGWSEPSPRPLGVLAQAAEARATLEAAGERGPFVLVGHSYGGLIVRRMAMEAPESVAGMVLLDAAEEGVVFRPEFLATLPAGISQMRGLARLGRIGVVRAVGALMRGRAPLPFKVEPARLDETLWLMSRPSAFAASADEAAAAYATTPQAMRRPGGFGSLGSRPLIVIRHERPFPPAAGLPEDIWVDGQHRLAACSTASQEIVADGAGHDVAGDRPDLVEDAIRRVVEAVRSGQPLATRASLQ